MSYETRTRRNERQEVQQGVEQGVEMTREAATGKWMTRLARLGYATKGVVYLIIGGLAAQLTLGQGGSATDQHGALQTIYGQPFGKVLLGIVAIGLLGFGIWCFIQAIFDTEGKGRDAKGIASRVGYVFIGVSYLALAFGAAQLVFGTGNGGKSSTATTQDWTALLLKQPFGVALVVLLGLIVLGVAFYLFMEKVYKASFRSKLNLATLDAQIRKWIVIAGRFGYGAQGVVLSIIGIFLIVAAVQHDPHQAKGLDSALQTLQHQSYGMILLGIVALGMLAYGAYSFVEARYRRVGRG